MSHLQNLLNEIEAEAAQRSAAACANAAMIEIGGDTCARINAAGERDVCFITWHLENSHRPCVTLQADAGCTDADFINAMEAAGLAIEQLPARIAQRNLNGSASAVYLMIAPGVDALIHTIPHRNIAATQLSMQEAA